MRILLADDESNVRFALRTLLERQPGVQVVGEAADSDALLSLAGMVCPDMLLLDCSLRGAARVEPLRVLREIYPDLIIIAISGRPEMRRVALTAGANAFICKTDPPEKLLAAIAEHKHKESES